MISYDMTMINMNKVSVMWEVFGHLDEYSWGNQHLLKR